MLTCTFSGLFKRHAEQIPAKEIRCQQEKRAKDARDQGLKKMVDEEIGIVSRGITHRSLCSLSGNTNTQSSDETLVRT